MTLMLVRHDELLQAADVGRHKLFYPHLFSLLCYDMQIIYVSVRGREHVNVFSVIIWDRIFNEEEYTVYVPEGIEGYTVIDLLAEISIPNER